MVQQRQIAGLLGKGVAKLQTCMFFQYSILTMGIDNYDYKILIASC